MAEEILETGSTSDDGVDVKLAAIESKLDGKLELIRRDLAVIKHAVKALLLRSP